MSYCSQCHAPMPEDSPLGVCPACLLEGGARKEVLRDEVDLSFLEESSRIDGLGVLDSYEVLEVLGQGATGIVLKAEDPSLRRMVAIKVLHPVLATSAVSRERFLREARAAAAVSHEHVVTIHAVAEWNGLPYLVMECIAGRTLEERIREDGPLELKEILRIGQQMASGLAAAHGHGLVHRDIKPGNVLLENGVQRVKLADFGLALAHGDQDLTLTGFVAGTPEYMAPEQAEGELADARSDLYSFGAVLYAMASGLPPFRGATAVSVLRKVVEKRPKRLSGNGGGIPPWLDQMVRRLLAKDPSRRPQKAEEVNHWFAEKLACVQRGEHPVSGRMRHWRKAASVAALAVLLIAGGMWIRGLLDEEVEGGERGGNSASPSVEISFDRALFERLVAHLSAHDGWVGTDEAPAIEDLLALGSRVGHLGWYGRGGAEDDPLPDLVELGTTAGLEQVEAAVFVVFITGPNEGRPRPFLRGGALASIEAGRPPPGGAWVGSLIGAEGSALLPEERRKKGVDVWAVAPPEMSEE